MWNKATLNNFMRHDGLCENEQTGNPLEAYKRAASSNESARRRRGTEEILSQGLTWTSSSPCLKAFFIKLKHMDLE